MSHRQMRAIIKERAAPGLTLTRRPVPAPGPGEVRVRVKAVGLCGTDLHIWLWDKWAASRVRPGIIVGHEFMGIVDALGAGVATVAVGDRVSGEGHLGCGRCYLCRTGSPHLCERVDILGIDVNGCFADYLLLPASNLWLLAPDIPGRIGAIHDPFGNAMHTVMSVPVPGRTVLLVGAGMIGAMAAGICRAIGALQIIAVDPNPERLALARKMGAHRTLDPRHDDVRKIVRDLTGGTGVDTLLEMSGNPEAIRSGLELTRNGGEAALLGIPTEPVPLDLARDLIFKGLTLRGVNGRRMFETWFQCAGFLRAGLLDLSPVITQELPLEAFEEGFQRMQRGGAGKTVLYLEPPESRNGWSQEAQEQQTP